MTMHFNKIIVRIHPNLGWWFAAWT